MQKGFFVQTSSSHLGAPSCERHHHICARAGTRARLRAKQGLLATLVERCRDGNAYTRARTLQTWAALAEASAVPLGHWVCITQLAAGATQPPKSYLSKRSRCDPRNAGEALRCQLDMCKPPGLQGRASGALRRVACVMQPVWLPADCISTGSFLQLLLTSWSAA